ncbi:hypothetical protein [Candidatus Neptunochlamydia vexilliferae]|uniref:Uncharacterized protein n=1 Tax=Candidatus Neptunichlamydia vexilliferae TaxID=1651774 RepID=A0ABS0AYG4_9BACT|nr:hypothetical protein [Candidatus Neptunochlamydia vexilliferae]MBF5059179.1 hypothetical protein [Candidatus Neptunochlamydia vexilliferae]
MVGKVTGHTTNALNQLSGQDQPLADLMNNVDGVSYVVSAQSTLLQGTDFSATKGGEYLGINLPT